MTLYVASFKIFLFYLIATNHCSPVVRGVVVFGAEARVSHLKNCDGLASLRSFQIYELSNSAQYVQLYSSRYDTFASEVFKDTKAPNVGQKLNLRNQIPWAYTRRHFCTLSSGQVGVWAGGVCWWLEMWSCKAVRHLGGGRLLALRRAVAVPSPTNADHHDLHRPTLPQQRKAVWWATHPFKQLLSTFARLQTAFRFEELSRDLSNIMVIKVDAGNDQMTRIAEESL